MKAKVKLKGKEKVLKQLDKVSKKYPEATAASLYQEGLAIMAESDRRIPVDTGRGRSSHYTAPPKITATSEKPIVEVGYGVDYLVYVHEKTEYRHKVGEAKFLQNAINERSKGYASRLAKRIKQNVEKGMSLPITDIPEKPQRGD